MRVSACLVTDQLVGHVSILCLYVCAEIVLSGNSGFITIDSHFGSWFGFVNPDLRFVNPGLRCETWGTHIRSSLLS